jgi:polyketide cyclase/dehydrase/lipid transport protein
MKKFSIFVGVLLAIVLAAVLIIGAIEPTDIKVSRSILIKAPKEAVFEQMVIFKNWTHWSPWYKMDSTMKMTYTGTDGQPGSGYSWVGSSKTGAGSMTNKGVTSTRMDFEVNFTEPRQGKAQGILSASDTAGMTRATWTFVMHIPYPLNAMCVFMNMDKMLGGDFESGLNNMKNYVETTPGAVPMMAIDVKDVDYPAHNYVGVRQNVGWNDMLKFFMNSYVMLKREGGDKISGPAVGFFYTWDTATKSADVMAAFPVSDTSKPVSGATFMHTDASRGFVTVQKGDYSKSMEFHEAMKSYVSGKGKMASLIMEEYELGPIDGPDSTKWVTNIYYFTK